jgi:UDP-3-O-[3-hydroxymyristoyl] N-acetylglucosamine deacetylase/3-hydroxyacyl-[acyl-carrier-protein] dehydratase
LHYPNEAARHKLLDVIGDLALSELEFKEKLSPTNQDIMLILSLLRKMSKIIKIEQKNHVPCYDLNKEPLMDIHKIMSIFYHIRPPFLFIDRIIEMSDTHVVGMKNVTMNEFFRWTFSRCTSYARSCNC